MSGLAIISGSGALPLELARAYPNAMLVTLKGAPHDHSCVTQEHRFERLGVLFADMSARNVTEVVFAGGMARPSLDPALFDDFMQSTAPRLMAAFQQGDDHLLRLVTSLFEEQGFAVRGAHELLKDLVAQPGLIAGPMPSDQNLSDAAYGQRILTTLAELDLGQGTVVAAGLCLGIETLQGTDALLRFVGETPAHLHRTAGTFVKAPKAGQDLRVDMPAIGPKTIENLASAGLAGIVVTAGQVLLLERAATIAKAQELGVFIYGQEAI